MEVSTSEESFDAEIALKSLVKLEQVRVNHYYCEYSSLGSLAYVGDLLCLIADVIDAGRYARVRSRKSGFKIAQN